MPLHSRLASSLVLPGAPGFRVLHASREDWLGVAREVQTAGGSLLALWAARAPADAAAGGEVYAAYVAGGAGLVAVHDVADLDVPYPSLQEVFPVAARMQRAAYDLTGVRSNDSDARPWLRHASWPAKLHPLTPDTLARSAAKVDDYEFVRVVGEGVHEIAVGPVHAGIIEPGHFRFSVVGEKLLKLEERLGWVHKGIERRFTELPILEAHRLAARVSGDSAVAFAWAYCQALEGLAGCAPPPRAVWLRALYLEIERIQNHLGDLGALGNDAGFAFGLMQFSRLKETLVRAVERAFGRRYLFDVVVPGGVAADLHDEGRAALAACAAEIDAAARTLRDIYDNHTGLRDRFLGAGQVTHELASLLGLTGFAGRASGQPFDARLDLPCEPYASAVAPVRALDAGGDVAARVAVRFDELFDSLRLVAALLARLPEGEVRAECAEPAPGAFGVGLIEGWRGPAFVALQAGANGSIRRCHPHDPSWQNWPVLEHAVIDNIVPDFPLINKSFNLSYSGHDL